MKHSDVTFNVFFEFASNLLSYKLTFVVNLYQGRT